MLKSDLQLFIRSGGFAWPGGYQCALLMSDGGSIDSQSAREIPSAYGPLEDQS